MECWRGLCFWEKRGTGRTEAKMTVKMLVTDDDPSLMQIYRRIFGSLPDVDVDFAMTDRQARDLIAVRRYDIAFFDIDLGAGGEGVSLLEHLRNVSPSTYAVMMSSRDDFATVGRCLGLGAKAFASKNLDFIATVAALATSAVLMRQGRWSLPGAAAAPIPAPPALDMVGAG
jgi:DNA-binding NarL/FixJ family response regulator